MNGYPLKVTVNSDSLPVTQHTIEFARRKMRTHGTVHIHVCFRTNRQNISGRRPKRGATHIVKTEHELNCAFGEITRHYPDHPCRVIWNELLPLT